jgi:hypothetical protein
MADPGSVDIEQEISSKDMKVENNFPEPTKTIPPSFTRYNLGMVNPLEIPTNLPEIEAVRREESVMPPKAEPTPLKTEGPVRDLEHRYKPLTPDQLMEKVREVSRDTTGKEVFGDDIQEESDIPEELLRSLDGFLNYKETPISLLTNDQRARFEEAKKTGRVGSLEVIGTSTYGSGENKTDALVIKNPETGEKALFVLGIEQPINLYYVDEPDQKENADEEGADQFLERILSPYEGNVRYIEEGGYMHVITPEIYQSVIATINSSFKRHVDPNNDNSPMIPTISAEFRQELVSRARGRIVYHNSAIAARIKGSEFADRYLELQLAEHQEVLKMPGVEQAIQLFTYGVTGINPDPNIGVEVAVVSPGHANIYNEGRFYRLEPDQAKAARRKFKDIIKQNANLGDDANLADAKAWKAVDIAEKAMHCWGESGRYDGIRVNPDTVLRDSGGNDISSLIGVDGYVSVHLLNAMYDEVPEPKNVEAHFSQIKTKYARFFEDHYDDINKKDTAGGRGALHMRGTMHQPVTYEKSGTTNRGVAKQLRRYTYLWVTSLSQYTMGGDEKTWSDAPSIRDSVVNRDNMGKMFYWAPEFSSAAKTRGVFADKGKESILNVPVINANSVSTGNTGETLPPALGNYFKAAEAFGHLSEAERKRAMAHLLKGVLREVNSREGRDVFGYLPWNDKIRTDALIAAMNEDAISRFDAQGLLRDRYLRISRWLGAFQDAMPEFFSGVFDGVKFLWNLIRGYK